MLETSGELGAIEKGSLYVCSDCGLRVKEVQPDFFTMFKSLCLKCLDRDYKAFKKSKKKAKRRE